jgi:hypothetical protein
LARVDQVAQARVALILREQIHRFPVLALQQLRRLAVAKARMALQITLALEALAAAAVAA